MFVLKSHSYSELSEAKFHVSVVLFTDKKIFMVATPNPQNVQLYAHPSTKKKDVVTECLSSDGISK